MGAESNQAIISLATTPATTRQVRLAAAIMITLAVVFAATAPFATRPLARVDAFIPTVAAVVFVTNLLTALLLFGQFRIVRAPALLVLASGYLFGGLIVIPYALSFPGAVWPAGLFGDLGATIWLYAGWHYGVAIALLTYAALKNQPTQVTRRAVPAAIAASSTAVVALVAGLLWAAASLRLPSLALPPAPLRPGASAHAAAAGAVLLVVAAAVCLWRHRRSSLDLWLLVAACAGIGELLLAGLLAAAPFDLGFYVSRAYAVVAATAVLALLLADTTRLYVKLSGAVAGLQRERDGKGAANRRLALQWARLRRANAYKSELLTTLAHDLRNPLTVIIGRSDMLMRALAKGAEGAEGRERLGYHVEQIQTAANRLDKMVESLLSDARADALDITIRPEETDLATLLHEVAAANEPLAAKKRQMIVVKAPPRCLAVCDGERLRDVADNLLSNAIKYSQVGGRIDLTLEDTPEEVTLRVRDEGAGLSAEDLQRVFGRFQRLSAKPTGDETSTGLGLSIVKRIVDLHGGSVFAESPGIGKGAIFTVKVPRTPTHKA